MLASTPFAILTILPTVAKCNPEEGADFGVTVSARGIGCNDSGVSTHGLAGQLLQARRMPAPLYSGESARLRARHRACAACAPRTDHRQGTPSCSSRTKCFHRRFLPERSVGRLSLPLPSCARSRREAPPSSTRVATAPDPPSPGSCSMANPPDSRRSPTDRVPDCRLGSPSNGFR